MVDMVDTDDVLREILELEHAGWRSLCDGTGHEFYGRMMTEEACMVLAGGTVMSRDTVTNALRDAPPWDGYEIDDASVSMLHGGAALLRYTGTGRRDDADDFTAIMSSVYVRVERGWRLASYQQTPVGS